MLLSSGIVGTAAQKWCIFRLLPFIMGHRVAPGSRYWHVFLLYKEIADIVMTYTLRKDELAYLELLVHAFLSEMTEVFENVLKPKSSTLSQINVNIWSSSFSVVYEIRRKTSVF